ncbi:MotA/TolQ/ExbB proton channel family protein [Persicimonas caeni]|jgi:biopolymer transport protein ExbB|uniref:MotA/TolQ/ExbB proton channel family protein n=1 Tax=Persicimonas caeni TaxID=2292766 RepID=A0A4Y6Q1N5_PERCE|nr:MotA/TolQ/ExbB proton channel family protein [Persicimonas caeni]QDG54511.1 MotA/TolQ/ExbB proton channel family protein [Persicimonas caeni]QED35732.1 MotA/TolQ/ExbB proton channel family protein [Persicimonas caeni]
MLTEILLDAALIGAEWVLWLLVILSLLSVLAMIERAMFYGKRAIDIQALRGKLEQHFSKAEFEKAAKMLEEYAETMEARVVLFGIRDWERGAAAVEDRMTGALSTEKNRYEKYLAFLGTVGNNAPFIGLFGTVLGIIGAFENLAEGSQEAAQMVMAAIGEALVATGVGLLVAIPAVIAFNAFKTRIKKSVAQTDLLGRTLLAYLRNEKPPRGADGTAS